MQLKRRYTTAYKKKVDVARDVYLPRRAAKGLLSCRGCGAVCYRRRWTLEPPPEVRKRVESGDGVSATYCPACQKMRDRYWLGVVQIRGIDAKERREAVKLMKNEETRAREKNPLERIARIANDDGGLRVETTTEKLAQRLGRSLCKAMGGKVSYLWSHNNKFSRVIWEKSKRAERPGKQRA